MLDKVKSDIKTAMLAGEKTKVTILRGLMAAVQSVQIDSKTELTQEQITAVFSKESKKRTEAADMYEKGGSQDRAEEEIAEKKIIDGYLPEKISSDELEGVVDGVITESNASGMSDMGKVVSGVKAKVVKEKLTTK